MTGRITGMVQYGKSLAILTESSIVVTHDNGKEPNEWPKEVFSDVGTNDEFVRQFADEFMELMGATSIVNPRLQEVKDAFMEVLVEGLIPAYLNLRQIRMVRGLRIPVIERRQQFENLSGALWRTYKTLMPKATILLGFDLAGQCQVLCWNQVCLLAMRRLDSSVAISIQRSTSVFMTS